MNADSQPTTNGEGIQFERPQVSVAVEDEGKYFNDPIHGTICLQPLLVKIIDTPQFQRLRNIKQLGATYFVYPGACHNRFEHCIGTAHLAGKLVRLLRDKQPELDISKEDVLCVEIAGLCHDLGHGPFSHMFDGMFMPEVKKRTGCMTNSTHEYLSCRMLDHLISDNGLETDLNDEGIKEKDLTFVKELIDTKTVKDGDPWPYEGRGEEKSFLYEIISNARNKVDVDKWDYFARDCHHLGIKNSFDHVRFMQFVRVLKLEGGRFQICARDKECTNLYEMFHVRSALHRRAYQHRVCNAIELMMCDAFLEAESSKSIEGLLGKKMSECAGDCSAFTNLDDGIFGMILRAKDAGNGPNILKRILNRKLYCYIGTAILKETSETLTICQDIAKRNTSLKIQDLAMNEVKYNYGMGKSNPVDQFLFYSKKDPFWPSTLKSKDISAMIPEKFEDREVQIFCKDDQKRDIAENCFNEYCSEQELPIRRDIPVTPHKKASPRRKEAVNYRKQLDF